MQICYTYQDWKHNSGIKELMERPIQRNKKQEPGDETHVSSQLYSGKLSYILWSLDTTYFWAFSA